MKCMDFVRYCLPFFFCFSFIFTEIRAEDFKITILEHSEVMKNPEATYIYLDSSVSDIKNLIIGLCKLDKDRQSPLHQFKRYIRGGFNIALYDEVMHVLEYAELVLHNRIVNTGSKKIKLFANRLSNVIEKVLNKELHYNVINTVLRTDDLLDLTQSEEVADSRVPTVVFNRPVEIEGDVVVRKNERIHGSLKVYQDTFLEGLATVGHDLVVERNARIHGRAKFYDTVRFKDSVHFNKNAIIDKALDARTVYAQNIVAESALIELLSTTDAVVENLEVISCINNVCIDTLSVNEAFIQSLTVPNGITLADASFENLSVQDAVITHLTVLSCIDNVCVDTVSVTDVVVDNSLVVSSFNTDGVLHNDAFGNVTTSLVIGSDIAAGTITNDKLANATSSNAPNTIVLRDAAGNFAANVITIDGPVLNSTDAATKDYVDSVAVGILPKDPAQVVATTNKTVSGLQVIDGVSLSANDRVLLVAQSNPVQNGLWLAQTGAWTRPLDFSSGSMAGTAYVLIVSGTVNADSSWLCDTPQATVDTDPLSFVLFTLPSDVTGANVGTGTGLVFRDKTGSTLNFRSLLAGSGTTVTNNANDITLGVNATSVNTPSTIVQRDLLGNFSAGTITAILNGNATGFTGPLSGDVTGTQNVTVVSFVGGQSAANVASAVATTNSGTSSNVPNSLIKRDGSGNFSAGTITATLNGTATSTVNFSGSFSGDVTGTQNATVVSFIGGQTATNVASATVLSNAATSANTANAIVRRNASGNFSAGTITATLNGNSSGFTGSLAGDVTGTQGATVVSFVGGQTAANVAGAAALTSTATSSNTANTLVLRNGAGNFSANIITATLNGNASTATNATTAVNFSGALAGDVIGTQGATVVSFVGGQTAANVASGSVLANAATNFNTANTIVKRDGSGNFFAGTITGSLNGAATSFSGVLSGDVTGTQGATVVNFVGGQSAANVASATVLANAATSSNTVSTIVRRNGSGDFSAGTITANLSGTATNFSGALSGDVTGVQSATVVSSVGGQSAATIASGAGIGNSIGFYSTGFTGGTTFTANAGTPTTVSANVVYTRVGNIVTVTIAATTFTVTGLPQYYSASGVIPVTLRPTNGQVQTVFAPLVGLGLYDPSNMGAVIINALGDITISRDANQILPWAVGANQGWDSITVSYCV